MQSVNPTEASLAAPLAAALDKRPSSSSADSSSSDTLQPTAAIGDSKKRREKSTQEHQVPFQALQPADTSSKLGDITYHQGQMSTKHWPSASQATASAAPFSVALASPAFSSCPAFPLAEDLQPKASIGKKKEPPAKTPPSSLRNTP